jgi:hypothetical protein
MRSWGYLESLFIPVGLSPLIHSIDQIKLIDRFREIPHEGPMSDLVWSDPVSDPILVGINDLDNTKESPDTPEFAISPRGAGFIFGKEVTKRFLHMNQLEHITRAHQLCMEGYQVSPIFILKHRFCLMTCCLLFGLPPIIAIEQETRPLS